MPVKYWTKDGCFETNIWETIPFERLHRENGPAIEQENGTEHWYINGKCHRTDGPAIIHDEGYQFWYLNGEIHRENGPAVFYPNGFKEWYINGKCVSFEEFLNQYKGDKVLLKLTWS